MNVQIYNEVSVGVFFEFQTREILIIAFVVPLPPSLPLSLSRSHLVHACFWFAFFLAMTMTMKNRHTKTQKIPLVPQMRFIPRFGNPSDFSRLFVDRDQSRDYLLGVLFYGALTLGFLLLWSLGLILLACRPNQQQHHRQQIRKRRRRRRQQSQTQQQTQQQQTQQGRRGSHGSLGGIMDDPTMTADNRRRLSGSSLGSIHYFTSNNNNNNNNSATDNSNNTLAWILSGNPFQQPPQPSASKFRAAMICRLIVLWCAILLCTSVVLFVTEGMNAMRGASRRIHDNTNVSKQKKETGPTPTHTQESTW